MSSHPYKLLRTTAGLTNDPDYAGTQTAPAALVTLTEPSRTGYIQQRPVQVEIVLEWLSAANAVVPGPGSYNVAAVRVLERDGGTIVVDSEAIAARAALPVIVDDVRVGDAFGVRLTAMMAPAGATKARVLYREIW